MNSKVSVLITCFNLEKYVGSAIESVLSQDYQGEVEIIVVDDCSTDRSAEIIGQFEGVRYKKTAENCGVLKATVSGLECATGDLIFFLDGDDVWLPRKISLCVQYFENEPDLGFLTHDIEYIDAIGKGIPLKSRPHEVLGGLDPALVSEKLRRGILAHSDYVWLGSAYAIRRSFLDVLSFSRFVADLPDPRNTYQDWPLAFWMAVRDDLKFGYIDEALFQYRVHGLNHSGDAGSVAKAVRNFKRAENTTAATLLLVEKSSRVNDFKASTERKLSYNRFLVALYEGRRWDAFRYFFGAFKFIALGPPSLIKELVRFFGIQLLGPVRFVAWLANVKR